MTLAAFLRDLEMRGVAVSASGDDLTLRAPRGALTDADRARLRAEKADILAWLRGVRAAPAEDDPSFPLTDIQQAYLVGRAAELELGGVGCHAYREFESGDLDLARLEAAWNRVVARHEMLRAVFSGDGRQRVLANVPPYRFDVLDLRDAPDGDQVLHRLREERSHRVFDPASWPLFEIHATRLPGRIRLCVGIDLLVADAAALITIFREWGTLYAVPDHELPSPAGRFRDHVLRHQAATAADRAYWEARLDTMPPGPDLPRLPVSGPPRFTRRTIRLPAPLWPGLKRAAAEQGLTPSALVATVYADILAAWSRRDRFSLTLTQFGAPAGMEGVVGDFTSTILLEVDSRPRGFLDRARTVQRQLMRDLDHASMSGVSVLRELRRHRQDMEPVSVVFTSTLGHPGLDPSAPSPLGWLGDTVYAITQTPQVAMDHHVMEEDGGLVASWDVREGVFPPGVVDGMVGAYHRTLLGLAQGSGWARTIADVLPAPSRAPFQPGAPADMLHAAFERVASTTPHRPAVIAPDRTLDYQALDRISSHLAGHIAARLGGPDAARDRLVAIELPKGWRQIAAVLGVVRAGAAYLPVDPALPAERRQHLIDRGEALRLDAGAVDRALDAALGGLPAAPPAVRDPARLAYVIYTSGSTGAPKGVMIEHAAAVTTVAEVNRRWGIGPDDRVLGLSSLSFDLSVWDIFGLLGAGGALVLPDSGAVRDPAHWAELLSRHRVTVWNTVPALMALQAEHGLPPETALRLVMMSGDWVPVALVERLRQAAPNARLVALGGATEAAIWSNAHEIGHLDPAWPSIPYGTPLTGQMLHVVNERGECCPDWVTGEIEIAGAGLARGYWRDPERTAERFVRNALTGERRYRTGDLGRFRPYGGGPGPHPIEFLGREDGQVKIQGHRIELGEIETAIAAHPDVQNCAAAALPAPGGKMLHAFVVPKPDAWERTRFVLERHGIRRLPDTGRRALPDRPAEDAYAGRRSVRRFAPGAVPLAALAAMLAGGPRGELMVRILARRVDGLAPGLWRYDGTNHCLACAPGPEPSWEVPDIATSRVAGAAAFLLALDPPAGMSQRDAWLAAGAEGQRLMQAAEAAGLGLCPIGVLRLDGAAVLHGFAVGVPATEAVGFDLAGALREHCAAVLPNWMVPRRFHLVPALPLSANGKLDRTALRPPEDEPVQAAGSALAERVGQLVDSVLGHKVDPRQNLFDSGATSLHIVRLQRLLAEQLGSELAVVDLFRLPTVAALAGAIAGEGRTGAVDEGLARAARRRQVRRSA